MRARTASPRVVPLVIAIALILAVDGLAPASASPDEGSLRTRWVQNGFSEGWTLDATDFDGDGSTELVYGGRGVGVIDADTITSGRPRWSFKWDDPPSVLQGGDNDWATYLETDDATGDGVPDVLVSGTPRDLYLLDGSTGERVWRTEVPGHVDLGATAIDADDDGVTDLFPNGNRVAISGATGNVLWEAGDDVLPKPANRVATGELDAVPGRDVIVATSTSSGVGAPNLHAVSSDGHLLYRASTVSQITSVTAADVDGDGTDEAIAGTFNGTVFAVGPEGVLWSTAAGPDVDGIKALAVTDVNDDGREDVLVGAVVQGSDASQHQVVALSGIGGAQLWRQPVPHKIFALSTANLDGDARDELLVGTGDRANAEGAAIALETGLSDPIREIWRVPTNEYVKSLEVVDWGEQRIAVIGAEDATLRAVDAATGDPAWHWVAGDYVSSVAAGDLTGDGLDEFVRGDFKGHVIATDVNGDLLWSARADVSNLGELHQVATGDVDGDGRDDVAVAGIRFQGDKAGVAELYNANGTLRWSRLFDGATPDVRMGDLDGDGSDEVVVVELDGTKSTIIAIDPLSGANKWSTALDGPLADMAWLDLGDIDGDGRLEVAYTDTPALFGGGQPHTALLEHDGSVRWVQHEYARPNYWVKIVPGAVIHGGGVFDGDEKSPGAHVTRRSAATGAVTWQTIIPRESDYGSVSRFGAVIPDQDGDGISEVAVATDSGVVHLLGGADGSEKWATRLEAEGLDFVERHQAGPLAYIDPGTGDPYIVASQWSTRRPRSRTAALGLDGSYLGAISMEGSALEVAVGRFTSDLTGAVVGAGLDLYAVDSCLGCPTHTDTTPDPEPTPSPSDSYAAQGEIAGSNPGSIALPGVTESEFAARCEMPASQGVDGYVFDLPDEVPAGAHFDAVGSNEADFYDLNVFFYDSTCGFLEDSVATDAADEEGNVPASADYVVVDNAVGALTTVNFSADLGGEVSPSPSPSPSTSPTPVVKGETSVVLSRSRSSMPWGQRFAISGQIEGGIGCASGRTVQIFRRDHGTRDSIFVAQVNSDANGAFGLRPTAIQNASYIAQVSETSTCKGAASNLMPVLVRPRINIHLRGSCKKGVKVYGESLPEEKGTRVGLEKRVGKKWSEVDFDRTDGKSRFRFRLRACHAGHRVVIPATTRHTRGVKKIS